MHTLSAVAALMVIGALVTECRSAEPAEACPGGIVLLPGFKHQKEKGKDTRVGKIWKEDGLNIRYDIGRGAGNIVKGQEKDTILWHKEQIVGGCAVHLAFAKDRTLYVAFPETYANFYGTTKSDEELADMLLIVLTYASPAKPH